MANASKTGGRHLLTKPSGGVIITDPARRAIINPGPSKECLARIERLDRQTMRPAR